MSEIEKPSCPYCECKERQKRYNKWHIKEIYCSSCGRCLNRDVVRRRTRIAEVASHEGKIDEFYEGTYVPSEELLAELDKLDKDDVKDQESVEENL